MIHAVILAGGWGRRFWPKSRERLPKQALCIGTRRTPAQNIFEIIKSYIPKERIWVVANKEHAQALRRQLPLPKSNFLIEPFARNTAAAVGLASIIIKGIDPGALTVVLSSDNFIVQRQAFLKAIKTACRLAKEKEALVTVGTPPHRPAQEYGYLKLGKRLKLKGEKEKIFKVEKFVEKPGLKKAKSFVRSKKYLWNAGIFAWKATDILRVIKKCLPGLYSGLQRIVKTYGSLFYNNRLNKEYKRFKDVSIDYGVMEKARNVYTVMGGFSWRDLGSWDNLCGELLIKDRDGNIIQGLYKGIDTAGSVILSEGEHLIATLGLRDLIVVHTPEATLICKKERAQDVKKLTQLLEKDKQLKKYL